MHPKTGSVVVVTGLGLVTGLGGHRESSWTALRAGQSAARFLDVPGDPNEPPYIGCPAADGLSAPEVPEPVLAVLDRAVTEAVADAGLTAMPYDPDRGATLIGQSKGGVRSLGRVHEMVRDPQVDPEELGQFWPRTWPSIAAHSVSRWLGLRGPCLSPVAACATGLVAVLQGAEMIQRGVCDWAVAGSVDVSLAPNLLGAFRRMRAMAHHDDPTRAVRPWNRDRAGFMVGEGAAVFVLERAEDARARGVLPYVEVAGGAIGCDGFHETNLNPDPTGLADLITRALRDADTPASAIDHVNLHGTATRPNDPLECQAIRRALGPQAERVACSANKAQIGHLLGAAGSSELAFTCLAIRDNFAPPTLNLTDPDPECDLDGTPLVGRPWPIRAALKLSIGFGGHLVAAVLRRPDGRFRSSS